MKDNFSFFMSVVIKELLDHVLQCAFSGAPSASPLNSSVREVEGGRKQK